MKKIFFSLGLPKNYIVKIQLRKLINTLRFMTYQKDCIYLLNKFRRNSYLEKSVQNSKKGWLYVTYDDRLSILGQRNSHTPLDIICSIARVHSNKSGKFCGTLSMISSNNRHTPRSLVMYNWINVVVKFRSYIHILWPKIVHYKTTFLLNRPKLSFLINKKFHGYSCNKIRKTQNVCQNLNSQ